MTLKKEKKMKKRNKKKKLKVKRPRSKYNEKIKSIMLHSCLGVEEFQNCFLNVFNEFLHFRSVCYLHSIE